MTPLMRLEMSALVLARTCPTGGAVPGLECFEREGPHVRRMPLIDPEARARGIVRLLEPLVVMAAFGHGTWGVTLYRRGDGGSWLMDAQDETHDEIRLTVYRMPDREIGDDLWLAKRSAVELLDDMDEVLGG